MTMYIIVGLGNFGKEYNNTRHNIGFDIIDRLAEQEGISVLEKKHRAVIGKGSVAGQKCILVWPQQGQISSTLYKFILQNECNISNKIFYVFVVILVVIIKD